LRGKHIPYISMIIRNLRNVNYRGLLGSSNIYDNAEGFSKGKWTKIQLLRNS